jgi:hypothetical protein
MGMTRVDVLFLVGVFVLVGAMCFPMLNRARVTPRTAICAMNLSSMWKGIALYQYEYKEKYPALANAVTLAQGPIDEEPEMVSILDPDDKVKYIKGSAAIKGNGSVNAYSLLIYEDYVPRDGFQCPSDDSYECLDAEEENGESGADSPEVLGFNGWGNLSYALQPTRIDAAAFSSRPNGKSDGEMAIASDQVVDGDTLLTKTDNRPKENNTINHGYEYANVLLMDGSVRKKERQKGADSTVSKWGYEGDEIFTKTQSADPVKRVNDSILMGKEGGE